MDGWMNMSADSGSIDTQADPYILELTGHVSLVTID